MTDAFATALIAELGKKTGVCWLRYDGRTHAAWHVWLQDALYLVAGGDEQPLPGIESAERVEVTMRSKENGGRLLTWVGAVSRVLPGSDEWAPATTALVAGRLNLADLSTAADAWAAHSVVVSVVPTGELVEAPGSLSDDAHLAAPVATRATTRGRLPRVLHRRVLRRPDLS
ncbi:MAG TPA: hypothetical protein VLA97_14820 [Nocardioidaceae bacterium]|nr:hypothetical protein [Nocardioidaceae bacterium]